MTICRCFKNVAPDSVPALTQTECRCPTSTTVPFCPLVPNIIISPSMLRKLTRLGFINSHDHYIRFLPPRHLLGFPPFHYHLHRRRSAIAGTSAPRPGGPPSPPEIVGTPPSLAGRLQTSSHGSSRAKSRPSSSSCTPFRTSRIPRPP